MTTHNSKSTQLCPKRSAPYSLAFGVACICLMLSNVVLAQEAKKPPASAEVADVPMVDVVVKVQEEKKKVADEIAQKSANATVLSAAVGQEVQNRHAIDHQARIFNDSPESQQLAQDSAAYGTACAGKSLQPAEYQRCEAWKSAIELRVDRHNETFAEFHRQYDGAQEKVGQKTSELVLENAGITKLQNYLSWLTAADSKLTTMLTQECKGLSGSATIEELKHRCGNIQFDAARSDLPVCQTDKCKDWDWVTFAKPRRTPEQAIQDYKNSGPPSPTRNPLLDKKSVPPPPK